MNVKENMNDQNNIQKELREMNSRLTDLNNESGFEVPEGYFDKLKSDLKNKTSNKQAKIFTLNKKVFVDFLKYAAILLITSSIIVGILSRKMENKIKEAEKNITTEDYILSDFETEEIIDYVVENDFYEENNSINDLYLNDIDETILIEEL
jgi:cell division protein FtsL